MLLEKKRQTNGIHFLKPTLTFLATESHGGKGRRWHFLLEKADFQGELLVLGGGKRSKLTGSWIQTPMSKRITDWESHFLTWIRECKVSRLTSTFLVCLKYKEGFPIQVASSSLSWLTWEDLNKPGFVKIPIGVDSCTSFGSEIFEKIWVSPRISKKSEEVEGEKVFFPGVLPKHGVWPFKVIEIYYLVGGFLYVFSPNLKNTMQKSKLDHVPRSKQKYCSKRCNHHRTT